MNINVSPDVYWNDCTTLPAIRGEIKSRIEDFRVFEMSNHDSFIDPTRVSTVFRPVRDDDCIIVQQTGRSNAGVTPLATADVAAYMESASFLPGISALNMWVHQPGLTATYTGEQKIVFAAPEITNRRLVYQYLKTHFPFCKAEKNTDGGSEEGYVVSADTSLLPLLAVGLPLADIINIYLYISRGPLTEDAAKGIAVGRGLDRTCRTAVYKCISKICPLLDSKTLDDKETGQKKQQLFWRRNVRERIQRQAQGDSSVVTKPAQARDIAGGMCTADSSQDLKSLKRNREDIDILCEESGCEATAKVHRADSSLYLLKLPRFIKFALIKKNIEQAEATRLLSDTMRKIVEHYDLAPGESIGDLFSSGLLDKSSVHALSVSGTKDKRGITSQWCCLEVLPSWINKALSLDQKSACVIESLSNDQRRYVRILEAAAACILNVNTENLGHDGIRVGDIEYSHSGLNLGQHWGNRFEIVIRNVVLSSSKQMDKSTCLVCNIRSGILESLENRKGFPNYFGSQRFGLVPNYCTDAPVSEEEKKEHSDNLIAESGVTEPIFCDESTTNRIPTGPQIGKYLIQCDFRSAVHCILLGNEYHFDPTTNTVVELGSWVCDSCVNLGKICTTELRNKKAMAVRLAREKYADGAAPSLVAKMLPGHMTKEKWLLQGLVRYCGDNNGLIGSLRTKQCISCQLKSGLFEKIDSNPKKSPGSLSTENDYQRAIEAVPYAARTIWIHAYGSWLWNKVAEYRLFNLVESAELPRTNCQFGDLVFDTDQKANRIQKKISQIDSNTSISSVVLPLMGSSVMFPGGDTGRFYKELLVNDCFEIIDVYDETGSWESFHLKPTAWLPKGAYRNLIQYPGKGTQVEWLLDVEKQAGDESSDNKIASPLDEVFSCCGAKYQYAACLNYNENYSRCGQDIQFCFSLPSGSYATVFLRELLHCDDML